MHYYSTEEYFSLPGEYFIILREILCYSRVFSMMKPIKYLTYAMKWVAQDAYEAFPD